MSEIWKSIEGFETYSVSTFGNVRNNKTGRMLKGRTNKGRLFISMRKNEIIKNLQIHRLVALVFIPNFFYSRFFH